MHAKYFMYRLCTPSHKREILVYPRKRSIQRFLFVSFFTHSTSINHHLVYMLLKMQEKTEKLSSRFDSLHKVSQRRLSGWQPFDAHAARTVDGVNKQAIGFWRLMVRFLFVWRLMVFFFIISLFDDWRLIFRPFDCCWLTPLPCL